MNYKRYEDMFPVGQPYTTYTIVKEFRVAEDIPETDPRGYWEEDEFIDRDEVETFVDMVDAVKVMHILNQSLAHTWEEWNGVREKVDYVIYWTEYDSDGTERAAGYIGEDE